MLAGSRYEFQHPSRAKVAPACGDRRKECKSIVTAIRHIGGATALAMRSDANRLRPEPARRKRLDRAMKIATYNVNGINGRLPNLLEWLEREAPDVVCLQELKATEAQFPIAAIRASWSSSRGLPLGLMYCVCM